MAAMDGNELLKACINHEFVNDYKDKDFDEFKLGICSGFVDGVTETMIVSRLAKDKKICFPIEMTKNQAIRVILHYIRDHPESLHEPGTILAIKAYEKAFPCEK